MLKKLGFRLSAFILGSLVAGLDGQVVARSASVESFDRLRVNEAVKSVEITDSKGGKRHAAKVNEIVDRQRILTTGAASRAELLADDGTVTRVGANTTFSFVEGKREVNLERGTLLFHSPTGRGGGVIRSPGATAGVIGTSVVVSATKDGGFKLLVLEGKAKATLPGGKSVSIGAGQLTFILPRNGGVGGFGPVVNFRLRDQVSGARLVTGFKTPLASLAKITSAIEGQEKKIAEGKIETTAMQISGSVMFDSSQVQTIRVQNEGGKSLTRALASDFVMRDGVVADERVFDYPKGAVPAELKKILGLQAEDLSTGISGENLRFVVARNLSILGKQDGTEVVTESPFIAVGKDSLVFNEGRSSDDPDLLHPEVESGYGPVLDPPIWFTAGKSVKLQDSTLKANSPWIFVGAAGAELWFDGSAVSAATVEIANSAVVNFSGMIGVGGSTVKILDSSLIAQENIVISGGEIEFSNSMERKVLAGYGGSSFNGRAPGSASAGHLLVQASSQLSLKGAILEADNVLLSGGKTLKAKDVGISARSSMLLAADTIDINSSAARDFLAGYGSSNGGATASGNISMRAVDTLNVKNANLGAANISLEARTIALEDVSFKAGSSVVLSSGLGELAANPNSNQPVEPRKVNFVRNVTYDNQPAQNQIQTTANAGGRITLRANGR